MIAALVAGSGAVAADSPTPASFLGRAYDRNGSLRYVEAHAFTPAPGGGVTSSTVYRDAQGRGIARMEATYSSHPFAPDYRMIDYRFDAEQVVRRQGAEVAIELRHGASRSVKRVAIDPARPLIVGPGFNEFIRHHWTELLAGRVFVADFVIPSRSDAHDRVQHVTVRFPSEGAVTLAAAQD